MSAVLMRVLESAPGRYDRGIRLLTLGQVVGAWERLATQVEPGWRVLDVGTGTGALALRAATRGAEVVAIDVNPAMLDIARAKAEAAGLAIDWREMGVAELDAFSEASFDAVCSSLCFSELTPGERRYALAQARRLLRPNGLLLLADEVRPQGLLKRLLHTVVRVPLAVLTWLLTQTTTHAVPDLVGLVRSAGFRVTEVRVGRLGAWAEVVAQPLTSGEPSATLAQPSLNLL